jgi:glycosyltransferase involved in cell wall biosynthesis
MQAEPSSKRAQREITFADTGRISVVIPAFNASAYLPVALQSVFDQTARPGEIVVVDDGSTDDTVTIARSFGVRVITLPNGGPSTARNVGAQAATGEYIAYLDADDLWAPDKLAVQLAAMQSYGQPAFSFTDYRLFDEYGVHKRSGELRHHWAFRKVAHKKRLGGDVLVAADGAHPVLCNNYIQPSSVIARRADVLAVGGFDEALRLSEDFEFFLRLFTLVPAVAVMKPLLLYRRHALQTTQNAASMKAGFFNVALAVAATPDRYPAADVRYLARTEFVRFYDIGIEQARVGEFDEAVRNLQSSVSARWTARASAALAAARFGRSATGRRLFSFARSLWRRRPDHR